MTFWRDPNYRLVTLTGPGGVGKSRLALQTAWAALHDPTAQARFADGVVLVALADLTHTDQLAGAIATALGLSFDPARDLLEQLLAALATQRLLLLLDNLEHLAEAPALLLRLLEAAPGLALLVTTRERLNLAGEWIVELDGLSTPAASSTQDAADFPAIDLFVQTAQAVQPDFDPVVEMPAIIEICQQLQGLPLGIQIVASSARSHTCRQLAAGLRATLDFVSTTLRNLPPRHRSLRAVFRQSWGLLTTAEQQLLQQLAIFAGGFSEAVVREVMGVQATILGALVDKSLVQHERAAAQASAVRYRLHPMVRQFAAEQLAGHPPFERLVRGRHSTYYCHLIAVQGARLRTPQAPDALALLRIDWENVRIAWQWAAAQAKLVELEQSIPGLLAYYLVRGPLAELQPMVEAALAKVRPLLSEHGSAQQTQAQRVAALLLAALAEVANERGFYAQAAAAAQETIEVAQRTRHNEAEAQGYLEWGRAHFFQGHYDEAHKRLSLALATALTTRNQALVAGAHAALGANRLYRGDYAVGQDHLNEALRLYEALGDRANQYRLRYQSALFLFYSGDFAAARAVFDDCLAHYRQIDDRRSAGMLLNNLGAVFTQLGDYVQAARHFEEALALKRATGDRPNESLILANLGLLATHQGDFQRAATHCRAALQISQELGERTLTAYAQTCFGHALVGLGWWAEAADIYQAALKLRQELGQRDQMIEPLAGLGAVYLALQQPAQALQYVEQIMPHLKQITAAGIVEPLRVYWTCYRVLVANQDLRATEVLTAAYDALQARAAKIPSDALRRFFLDRVSIHQQVLQAYAQTPSGRYAEGAEQWRTRIEQHSDLVHDLESILHGKDDAPTTDQTQ
jgi:predicted ATPase